MVTGANNTAQRELNANIKNSGLTFQVKASPLTVPESSVVLADAPEGALVYRTPLGRGTLAIAGVSLDELVKSDSLAGTILLAETIAPEFTLKQIIGGLDSSHISYTTQGTTGEISDNSKQPDISNKIVASLNFFSNYKIEHNQINWSFPLSQTVTANANGIVNLSLWSDGKPVTIGVALEQKGKSGYLSYDLPDNEWNGWKDFALPMSYFQGKEGEKINSIDMITISFNDDPPDQSDAGTRLFKFDDVRIVTLNNPASYSALTGSWEQANKFVLPLGDDKGVLWKESYMASWVVKDNLGRKVDYYFAGPGMIYLVPLQNATSITFEMPTSKELLAGIVISVLSFFVFIAYLSINRKT